MLHTSPKMPATPSVRAALAGLAVAPGASARTPAAPVLPFGTRTAGLPMWRGTVLACNAKACEDAYAIGVDGYVWTYRIDGVTG